MCRLPCVQYVTRNSTSTTHYALVHPHLTWKKSVVLVIVESALLLTQRCAQRAFHLTTPHPIHHHNKKAHPRPHKVYHLSIA